MKWHVRDGIKDGNSYNVIFHIPVPSSANAIGYNYQTAIVNSNIGSLILSNNAGTAVQKQRFLFSQPCRYGMPVVVNKLGQTLGSTAGDHSIVLTPVEEAVEDTV